MPLTLKDMINSQNKLAAEDARASKEQEHMSLSQFKELTKGNNDLTKKQTDSKKIVEKIKQQTTNILTLVNNQATPERGEIPQVTPEQGEIPQVTPEQGEIPQVTPERQGNAKAKTKPIKSVPEGQYNYDNVAGEINKNKNERISREAVNSEGESKGLRKFLLGSNPSYKPDGFLGKTFDKIAKKKEEKKAAAAEKADFIKNQMEQGKSKLPGNENGVVTAEEAETNYKSIKSKEAEVTKAQASIDKRSKAGYTDDPKLIEERDRTAKGLNELHKDIGLKPIVGQEQRPLGSKAENTLRGQEESLRQNSGLSDLTESEADAVEEEEKLLEIQKASKTHLESIDINVKEINSKNNNTSGDAQSGASAPDILSLGGSAMPAGMGSKVGSFLGKAGPGLLKGGLGAIGGMALSAGGEALTESGHEVAGGAVSTLGTAASYAGTGAMIGSIVPGVGTAIGAGVGGAIGLGKGLYDNWDGMFGGDEKKTEATKPQVTKAEMETLANEPVEKGKPLSAKQMTVADMSMSTGNKLSPLTQEAYDLAKKQPMSEVVSKPVTDSPIANASRSNEDLKAASASGKKPEETKTVLNTSNNVVNNKSITPSRKSTRNEERSYNRYLNKSYQS